MVRARAGGFGKKGKAIRVPAPGLDDDEELPEEEDEDVPEAEGEDEDEEGAAAGGDEEEDGEEEEEENLDEEDSEEEDDDDKPKKKKKKRSRFIDDEAGEEEEDEEEERGPKKKKKKKERGHAFIDDIAEAASDDEEDEDEDDEDDFIDRNEAKEAQEAAKTLRRDKEAAQSLDRQVEEEDVEKLQELVKQRYGKDRARGYKEGDVDDTPVDQEARQPGVNDPKLWMVKVRPKKERETVVCIMQKWKSMERSEDQEQQLKIMSVFAQDHLSGYIYIEADKEPHVRHAIKGLHNIYHSQPPRLVPIREMVESISVTLKTTAKIVGKTWARIRAGTYKNDLCFVESVEQHSTTKSASNVALVKLIPRLDYQLMASQEKISFAERNKRQRPLAKLFNLKEARDAGLSIDELNNGDLRVNGNHTFRNGFLLKEVAFSSLRPEPSPPFEELQRFTGAVAGPSSAPKSGSRYGDDEDEEEAGARGGATAVEQLAALASTLEGSEKPQTFRPGDKVKVVRGDLKGLTGVVASVAGDGTVNMTADHKDLQGEAIALKASDLAKNVMTGMHVRVTAGRHDGATGMVVRVDGEVVVLMTDILKEEIQVFSKDLTEAGQTSSGTEVFGNYSLHDLVILEGGVPGVIVKIEHQAALVLTSNGTQERPDVRTCRLPDIQRKIMGNSATAQDNVNNTVGKDQIVTVVEGTLRGKAGNVLWCHRGFVFLLCRDVVENGGVLCVRARSVKGPGGKAGGLTATTIPGSPMVLSSPQHLGAASMFGKPGANVLRSPSRDPLGAQPGGGLGGLAGAGAGMFSGAVSRGPGRVQDDPLVGKRVKVCKGPYKGYKGIVMAATRQIVRLELEANEKTVTVNRTDLDGQEVRPADVLGLGAGGMTPGRDVFGRTPMHAGGMTPGRESFAMTPSRETFGMTPSRDAFGVTPGREFGMTPGRDFGGYGSNKPTTPGGGFGLPFTGTPGNQYGTLFSSTPSGWGTGRTPTGMAGTPGSHMAATPDTTGYGSIHAGTPNGPMPGQWDAAAQEVAPSPRSIAGSGANTALTSNVPTSYGVGSTPTGQHTFAGAPLHEGVEVMLQSGEMGVVTSVAPDRRCRVDINGGRSSITALSEDLLLVQPRDKERVVILEEGPNRGRLGSIVGHDEDDVLVQYEDNLEVGLMKAALVGKYAGKQQRA